MKQFIPIQAFLILPLLFSSLAPLHAADIPSPKPNILVILVDDMGFSDLGCYGSEIETPNLDKLASGGLRFTQFYNTAKWHSSRISLLTGRYPYQAGNTGLNRAITVPEVLGAAGYFTAMTGKWHLDKEPTDFGFQRYFGHLSGATGYFKGNNTFRLNGQPWPVPKEGFYTTVANVDHALDFLGEARAEKKPWVLYVAFNAPHTPLQPLEQDYKKYLGRYDAGWAWMSNTPFRFYKQNQFEGGIATPAIVRWPKGLKTQEGSKTDVPVHLVDVLPTLAEVSGASIPATWPGREPAPLAGVSFGPVFTGGTLPTRPLYFLYDTDRGLRVGDWKLVSFRSNPWELYNLANDRTELHNLASQQPERLGRLARQWFQMANEVDKAPPQRRTPVLETAQPYIYKPWSTYGSQQTNEAKKVQGKNRKSTSASEETEGE